MCMAKQKISRTSPLPPDAQDFFIACEELRERQEGGGKNLGGKKLNESDLRKLELYEELYRGMREAHLRYTDLAGLSPDEVRAVSFVQQAIADIASEVDGRGKAANIRSVIRAQLSRLGLGSKANP